MIKLYNGHGDLLGRYTTLYGCCKANKFKANNIYRHFQRHPEERSYGIFEGFKSSGKLKYIIVKEGK